MIKASIRHLNKSRVKKLTNSKFYVSVSRQETDYRNLPLLNKFISPYGAIKPKNVKKLKHHKLIVKAIKRARYLGLISFSK